MTLEQQVTNKEISQRLKELGVKQESLFWWIKRSTKKDFQLIEKGHFFNDMEDDKMCSAFTVAELGEMLPIECESNKVANGTVARDKGAWVCYWEHSDGRYNKCYTDTEADARGKMLIYLLENKLITL